VTSTPLLAERYRLSRRIAVGGMGTVWEATDVRAHRTVAVKLLHPALASEHECLHRFRAEARAAASLDHPGIARVYGYGESAADAGEIGGAYLVMELVRGEALAAAIARAGRLAAELTLRVLQQSAAALQAAHEQGIVHRDVKPGNILLGPDRGWAPVVKLVDFGIAKAADTLPLTLAGRVMGAPHYIAPEQSRGQEATPSGDVYSLAVCGYECLAGVRPFRAENALTAAMMHAHTPPPPLPADVPAGLRRVIEAGMTKNPSRRYATGGEFAAALAAVRLPTFRAGTPAPPPRYADPNVSSGSERAVTPQPRGVAARPPVGRTQQSSEACRRSGQTR
jgi:serine/threonine-protein kinase